MGFQDNGEICRATVGLLFLGACGKRAAGRCRSCGRPVCVTHGINADNGLICVECAANEERFKNRDGVKQIHDRKRYHDKHDYHPYYYTHHGVIHHHDHFTDHDYQTFDARAGENGAEDEGATDGDQDWGSDNDYMDS